MADNNSGQGTGSADESQRTSADAGAQPEAAQVRSEAWEWIKALLVALGLVLIIRWLLFAPFIVEGPSMQPNFITGERLIVNKMVYRFRAPERGEVVVFHAPAGKDYIKRVIGLPGETVRVEGDTVYVNGQPLDEPYIEEVVNQAKQAGGTYNSGPHKNYKETVIPEGHVFAMGDNRPQSLDSRDSSVGFVPYDEIVGRADVIFWPIQKLSLIH